MTHDTGLSANSDSHMRLNSGSATCNNPPNYWEFRITSTNHHFTGTT